MKDKVVEHRAIVDGMITFYHEMNPRIDHGVRNGTVHGILSTLATLSTLLEMLDGQI